MARHGLVADDRDLGGWAQRCDPAAERGEDATADHDVVAARAERDVDDDGLARAYRRGHDARSPAAAGCCAAAAARWPASVSAISSTILSCGISRDWTVRSARA